jgi:hypothetical protein
MALQKQQNKEITKENSMNKTMRQVLLITVLILLLLSACAPAPAPAPTTDPNQINSQIETSVVLTVAAMNTATALAQPQATDTAVPTSTPLDTPTAVQPLDTPTALPLPTTASSGGSSSGGGTVTQKDYSCTTLSNKPADNTVFKPGAKFDIKWTIKNNGTKTMRAGLDLRYNNGDKLMPDTVVELPELKPGAEYSVTFDATAPSKNGTYIMAYMVEGGLCYPYTAIVVQK